MPTHQPRSRRPSTTRTRTRRTRRYLSQVPTGLSVQTQNNELPQGSFQEQEASHIIHFDEEDEIIPHNEQEPVFNPDDDHILNYGLCIDNNVNPLTI